MNSPEAFLTAYEQALATQEWESVAPLIHDDCVVTFSEGTYMGKAAVERAFRRTFSTIQNERFQISYVHWVQRTERYAVLVFNFTWSGEVGGQAASGSGRGTSVLVRQGGRWQLLCEHLGPAAAGG